MSSVLKCSVDYAILGTTIPSLLCVYLAGSTATHELTKTECGWPYVYLYAPPVVTHDGRSAQLTSSRVSNVGGCLFFGRSACVGESD